MASSLDLPDGFDVMPEMRNLQRNLTANLQVGHVILLQPVPKPIRVRKSQGGGTHYRGCCESYLCLKEFKTGDMRVSIEDDLNLLDPFSDQNPPERNVEIQNIGLANSATRKFHLRCLEEVLSWHNGPGLCAFAERLFAEPRVNQNGPRGAWQPKEAEQYIIEVWKAVQVYANSQRSTSMIPRATVPRIVVLEDHNYHLRAGPDNTLFQTREAFDLYSRVANVIIPATLQTTTMLNRRLHMVLQDKPSVAALQRAIDSANQNQSGAAQAPIPTFAQQAAESRARLAYYAWMRTQELGSQATGSYHGGDKASKEAKDHDIALKLGHYEPGFKLSQWLPASLNEAEKRAALKRKRYGVWSGINLEEIGEEGPVMGVLSKEDEGVEIDEDAYEDDVEAAAEETEGEEVASGSAEKEAAKVPASGSRKEESKEKSQNKAEGEKKRKGASKEKSDEGPTTAKRRKEKGEKDGEKESEEQSEKQAEKDGQKKSDELDDEGKQEHASHSKEQAASELEQTKTK